MIIFRNFILRRAALLLRFDARSGSYCVKYVPPFEAIKAQVSFAAVKGELTVSVSYTQFTAMVRILLQGIRVDEDWYRARYPDVAQAIRDGTVPSAADHFLSDGYFEGRMPFPIEVDEAFYLNENPGLSEFIARGELESAQRHFEDNGYREGRRPFSEARVGP